MAIGDTYRFSVQMEHVTGRDDAVNVMHFRQKTANIYPNGMEDLVRAWIGQGQGNYLGVICPSYELVKYAVKQVTGGTGEYEMAMGLAGTYGIAGDQLPSTVAALISWRTGFAGRSKRGRTFLPPTAETALGSGIWTPTFIGLCGSCATGILNIGTHAVGTYGQWEIGVYSPLGGGFTPYTS